MSVSLFPVPAALAPLRITEPLGPCAMAGRTNERNSLAFIRSHLRDGDDQPTCASKVMRGLSQLLPFLVVTRITPLDARAP